MANAATTLGTPGKASGARRRDASFSYLIPALLLVVIFFIVPVLMLLLRSVTDPHPGLQNYAALLGSTTYLKVFVNTFVVAGLVTVISVVIGIPLGIACARSDRVQKIVTPVLDFMQTMPAFVYLLPAVAFFSLGVVPGVIASVIFGIPPTIRLTNLGIRQVPADLVEAADAFGSTPMQKLFKLQLPIAAPTIMAGVNQTIMLSLSMVVIASMIGAQGVGADVYRAVTQAKTGVGFEAGLAVVVLAIILDRITQNLVKNKRKGS